MLYRFIHTWMTCLLEEAANITGWSIDVYLVVAQRTNHVVLTIGIPQTRIIVSATVTTFPFIDWGKHIINYHTSRLVTMIEEWCIRAVIGLGCIGAIWKINQKLSLKLQTSHPFYKNINHINRTYLLKSFYIRAIYLIFSINF